MFRIVKRYPLITFFGLNYLLLLHGWLIYHEQRPYTPFLAALIVVPIVSGLAGLKDWASRIVRWRVGVQWYAAAVLVPLIATGTAAYLNIRLGASFVPFQLSHLPALLPQAAMLFLYVGLGEEPGWRGFAVPQLQKRFSAITTSLIIAVMGIGWHLPIFLRADRPWANILPIIAGYFVFTWLFNNSRGSVLIVMLLHAAHNTFVSGVFGAMFYGANRTRYSWLMGLAYVVIVIVILVTSRNRYLISGMRNEDRQVDVLHEEAASTESLSLPVSEQ